MVSSGLLAEMCRRGAVGCGSCSVGQELGEGLRFKGELRGEIGGALYEQGVDIIP